MIADLRDRRVDVGAFAEHVHVGHCVLLGILVERGLVVQAHVKHEGARAPRQRRAQQRLGAVGRRGRLDAVEGRGRVVQRGAVEALVDFVAEKSLERLGFTLMARESA